MTIPGSTSRDIPCPVCGDPLTIRLNVDVAATDRDLTQPGSLRVIATADTASVDQARAHITAHDKPTPKKRRTTRKRS